MRWQERTAIPLGKSWRGSVGAASWLRVPAFKRSYVGRLCERYWPNGAQQGGYEYYQLKIAKVWSTSSQINVSRMILMF